MNNRKILQEREINKTHLPFEALTANYPLNKKYRTNETP